MKIKNLKLKNVLISWKKKNNVVQCLQDFRKQNSENMETFHVKLTSYLSRNSFNVYFSFNIRQNLRERHYKLKY